jgi:hypothetical protein
MHPRIKKEKDVDFNVEKLNENDRIKKWGLYDGCVTFFCLILKIFLVLNRKFFSFFLTFFSITMHEDLQILHVTSQSHLPPHTLTSKIFLMEKAPTSPAKRKMLFFIRRGIIISFFPQFCVFFFVVHCCCVLFVRVTF